VNAGYKVRFGSLRIEKEFAKFLRKLPQDLQRRLYDVMKGLGTVPRPPQGLRLRGGVEVFGYTARYRLRLGDYRLLYDVERL